jgi:ATP-binding cassette subfamily B protein
MEHKQKSSTATLIAELRETLRRGHQVWWLVPRRYKLALGGAVSVMAITSGTNTILALVTGRLVDALQLGRDAGSNDHELYRAALAFLGLIAFAYFIRELCNVVRRYLVESCCTRIDRDLSVRLVEHLMRIDLGALTHEKIGALNGRITRSVAGFVRFLRLGFLDFLPALLTGAISLSAAIAKQPRMGLVMCGVIPISLGLTFWQLLSQKGIRLKLIRSREEMDGTVVEQLSGMDYVRVANTQSHEIRRVAAVAEDRRGKELRHQFQMSLFGCGKALNEGFFHIFVLAWSVYFAINGMIQFPGDILVFSMLFLNVMTPLSEVHRIIDEGHESSLLVGDLLELLTEPIDESFNLRVVRKPRVRSGVPLFHLEGLRVDYKSPTGKRKQALRGIDLNIQHGETIGVAGRSGSGKSTWVRVLLRLTHPSSGSVYFGGRPIESVSRESIGKLVGYVGQVPFVFAGTIAENIAYGGEQVSPEMIRRAAMMAHLHDEIMAMPAGYDTLVAERGQNLSGGQKQRIALARVFLKNPPILILDEGTSALDNISERHVQRALFTARADRTVILVAHRLSTLREADRIFVFDDGRLVEEGSYTDLIQSGGAFTDLVSSAAESPLTLGSPTLGNALAVR